jgi:hypothetical protein
MPFLPLGKAWTAGAIKVAMIGAAWKIVFR